MVIMQFLRPVYRHAASKLLAALCCLSSATHLAPCDSKRNRNDKRNCKEGGGGEELRF